jgi:glycosyltransferase involved in cell wall biosynthesis
MRSCLVLIISDDILLHAGIIGRAGGIRAWGIGEGLKENSLQVYYAVRTQWWPKNSPLPPQRVFERYWQSISELEQIIKTCGCDVIINCSYSTILPKLAQEFPVIQDSNGPRLLERAYLRPESFWDNAWFETSAYTGADYFICPSQRQLTFFYPWLFLSGFSIEDHSRFAVIRLGIHGDPPHRNIQKKRIVYTGSLLPWTDPRKCWKLAIEEVERVNAQLLLILSKLPINNNSIKFLLNDLNSYRKLPCCKVMMDIPFSQYLIEITESLAALDVMENNIERELAMPTRTITYLWAGVPIIIHNYSEIGELVSRYDAGWVVSPEDKSAIREATREALNDIDIIKYKSKNASTLHKEIFDPKISTVVLANMCLNAEKRHRKRIIYMSRVRRIMFRCAIKVARKLSGVR